VSEQVLQDADTAMYQVKRSGGARHAVVDLREQSIDTRRADLSRDLRDALRRGQLRTEYQPIVAMADGHLAGVEALLRWSHPDLGLVGPETAVPLAEQTGLISEIGRWMLEQACLDRKRWATKHQAHGNLDVAVNVSAHQLMGPDFAGTVEEVLTATSTAADLVTLEVTESVFLQDSARALIVLQDLKDLGVRLALDDFGTGYSSLSYLKQFPVDIVKIDRSFVADLGHDPTSRHIVSAIVGLGHDLRMTIVAEGVESPTQYEEVLALGCDAYQGYYFSRPQRAEDLEELLVDELAVEAGG
jgi:EAL domain-containing protein (putative c-di-GMP-specific phosphodiesterase class I)